MQTSSSLTPLVLARSPEWLVLFKPAGMLTIPPTRQESFNRGNPGDPGIPGEAAVAAVPDLLAWAREHHSPVWITHRLDRETSGVILLARTAQDHRRASLWFQERKIKKQYYCLASGLPQAPFFKVNEPIRGAPSVTQIEVQKKFQERFQERFKEGFKEGSDGAGVFFAKVFPRTGRRHQIRIHLAKSGHPLLGDELYGGPKQVRLGDHTLIVERVALHAGVLELPTGEKFEAPFPEDFLGWLSQLRGSDHRD